MNCTKCGKEITEEGKTLCDECQKALLEEIKQEENDAKEEVKGSKDTEKKNKKEKKVKKDKNSKEDTEENKERFKVSKEKGKKSVFKRIAVIVIIALVLLVAFLIYSVVDLKKVGNEIGNIRNYGYATKKGNTIYYLAPNDLSNMVGIFSIDAKGDNKKEIYTTEEDILSLNIYGNYLYFITVSANQENAEEYNNKICRIKTNGTGFEVINDNEFNDYCYEIYAVKNKIYYIGEDSKVYKMNLNGSNRELVSDIATGYVGITDKYIVYNDYVEGTSPEEQKYKTCIMNLDGSNKRTIVDNTRLYTVNIVNDVIYYTNENLEIYKMNIDGSNNQLVLDTEAYNLNVSGNYIYYLNYADIENDDQTICIYRVNLDGTDNKIIKKLDTGTSFINVVGDWVLYMDSTLEAGYIKIVKIDGSEERNLYTMDFKKLYEQYANSIEEETVVEDENQTEQPETNNTVSQNVAENTVNNTVDNTVNNNVENTAENTVENTVKLDNAIGNNAVTNEVANVAK